MHLLFRLLSAKTARTLHDWMVALWAFATVFVGDANLDRFQRWLWGTPQQQQQQQVLPEVPPLDEQMEALYLEFLRQLNIQYEVGVLRRELLTLPPPPDEGY
jgi:hypothetical protein